MLVAPAKRLVPHVIRVRVALLDRDFPGGAGPRWQSGPVDEETAGAATPGVEVITPREVPLGGPRAMSVRRTLPQKARSLVGAWCFVDHYGPDDVAETGGMLVPPHPHTGLQTVSWLFSGEIEHRDSGGGHALVRPGEVNLMTAGRGIAHSEVSTPSSPPLHGVQLWVALPDDARHVGRGFERHVTEPVEVAGATLRVLVGELAGVASPVRTFSPLLGAEILLPPGGSLDLDIDPAFEHGVLVDTNAVSLGGTPLVRGELGYVCPGATRLALTDLDGAGARVIVLGGVPFAEPIVMWWNFVARTHDEVVEMRAEWNARGDRFGEVEGYAGDPMWLPAPELPHVVLRPRANPPAVGSG
jgi:quercetin 2,3-dioxygenase